MRKSMEGVIIIEFFGKMKINRHGHITPYRIISDGLNKLSSPLISESEAVYEKSNLGTFGTHKEMNEADAKEMAALSPTEHIQNATELTKKLFAEELKKPMNKKLRFR